MGLDKQVLYCLVSEVTTKGQMRMVLAETKGKTPFQFRSFQMVISGVSVKALDILVSDLTMSTCQNEIEFDLPVEMI